MSNQKTLIMEHNSEQYQNQTTSSASTMIDSGSTPRSPQENDVRVSFYSDESACTELELNKFGSDSSIRISNTRSAAISSTDKEIEAARLHILSLLTRRNGLAPVSLLPSELLARIFHFHALDEPSWSNGETFGWIKVTHVCRYWRHIALEDSSLWARFSGLPPSTTCLAEILARAKGVPLTIDFDGPQNSETFSIITSHLSHTRELRLRNLCDSFANGNSIQELCNLEAPMLEHFELEVPSFYPMTIQTFDGTRLFKGQASKLRTFSLCQIPIPWSLVPRTQLSQLRIVLSKEIFTVDAIQSFGLNQLIDALTYSPTLEDLVLKFCLPPMLSHCSAATPGQIIHLPRLSHLCLAGSSPRVARLLEMFELPSSTKLHLRCASENNKGLILPIISAHFNRPKPITFKSVILTLNCVRQSIELTASSSLPTWTNYPSHTFDCDLGSDAELFLSIDTRFYSGHFPNTLEEVCTMLPIAEIEFLSISASDVLHSIKWGELFRHCEKISTIKTCGHGTTTLLQALTPPEPSCTTSSGKGKRGDDGDSRAQGTDSIATYVSPVFPKLTTLLLRGLDFSENVSGCGDLYYILTNALRRRMLHKVPLNLKKLSIDSSIISAKRASALEKLVQEFHWGKVKRLQFGDFDSDEFDYDGENNSDYPNGRY